MGQTLLQQDRVEGKVDCYLPLVYRQHLDNAAPPVSTAQCGINIMLTRQSSVRVCVRVRMCMHVCGYNATLANFAVCVNPCCVCWCETVATGTTLCGCRTQGWSSLWLMCTFWLSWSTCWVKRWSTCDLKQLSTRLPMSARCVRGSERRVLCVTVQ